MSKSLTKVTSSIAALGLGFAMAAGAAHPAAAAPPAGLKNGTIGFALVAAHWGMYQTPNGKEECANGFNDGPRDQFKILFPNGGSVVDTQLEREGAARYPTEKEDKLPYHEVTGKYAYGMNLNGKVGPNDFVSPDGEKGIQNQLYRAIGCTVLFRGPEGTFAHFSDIWVREMPANRILVELTGVHDLVNDDNVTVHFYRGKDKLIADSTSENIVPGGSNRADERFSKKYTQTVKGKIVNGVLITEPPDLNWAWGMWYSLPGYMKFEQARLKIILAPNGETAEGMVAGYADIDTFSQELIRAWSTHHSAYGGLSQPSLTREMYRIADGIPDANGKNTAISFALQVKFTQTFIQHANPQVAATPSDTRTGQ